MPKRKLPLSHPSWQGISGILNVIAILVSVLIAYLTFSAGRRTLTIISLNRMAATTDDARINFTFEGATLPRYITAQFQFKLKGERAIMPDDFKEPFTVGVSSDYRILSVTAHDDSVKTEWKKVSDQQWEFSPQLINPEETVSAVVIVADAVNAPSEQLQRSRSRFFNDLTFAWKGRFTNMPPLLFEDRNLSFYEDGTKLVSGVLFCIFPPFGLFVFSGVHFWIFLLLLVLLMVSSCLLVRRQKPSTSPYRLFLFAAAHTILGVLTAENILWIASHGHGVPWFCYVVVPLYVMLTVFLIKGSSRRRRTRVAPLNEPIDP